MADAPDPAPADPGLHMIARAIRGELTQPSPEDRARLFAAWRALDPATRGTFFEWAHGRKAEAEAQGVPIAQLLAGEGG
ncbi:hypothetical protein [Rubellimicrobium aerolatum]|uniref:DUF4880 domain-containing protein n=1 Tax=Rubellimicrobium aerolatum TaxID=490979 RepID=A0ABW0SFC4_9RHOB|nr:hypothetical protein [Rubellimicrobium aerolatum]MBP1806499.1 hypothetical protein [Rubellimicrobium aerolatum]